MSSFKLPFLSPLAGTTLSNLRKVLKGNRVAPRHYFKVGITYIFVFISSLFQWIDQLLLKRKIKNYTFKESPLFVIGHWRSGTTFLHNILTKDPASGYVTTYHAVFPNNLKSKWLFKTFMRVFMPDERPGDHMKISVDLPQEDEYAMSNITPSSYYHFFYFPSNYKRYYRSYVRFLSQSEDQLDAWKLDYRKLVVMALINTNGRRAVLKNPVNTGRIIPLQDIFPDAKFVFLVRNPIIVYLSSVKFFLQLFPTLNLENFTSNEISALVLDTYVQMLNDYLKNKKQVSHDRIIEVRYEELKLNPLETIREIYSRFSIGNLEEVMPNFHEYLDSQKEHKVSPYSIPEKELDIVLQRLEFAMKHWNYEIPPDLDIIRTKSDLKSKKAPGKFNSKDPIGTGTKAQTID